MTIYTQDRQLKDNEIKLKAVILIVLDDENYHEFIIEYNDAFEEIIILCYTIFFVIGQGNQSLP